MQTSNWSQTDGQSTVLLECSEMQRVMILLILTGQPFLSTCLLYEYHFIKENMTWERAQNYCRTNYTDLAKVFDEADVQRLLQEADHQQTEAWIGLHNNSGESERTWHWSLPGIRSDIPDFHEFEPSGKTENCAVLRNNVQDFPCNDTFRFVCYDEKNTKKKFHLIETCMNWSQAQNYCRHHHTDLISGAQQVKEFNTTRSSETTLWIGLFRDTWRWSDGSRFSFRHWDKEPFEDLDGKCATTLLNKDGKWSFDGCNETKPFFCYKNKLVLYREIKTWENALDYCRARHHDLVIITNRHEQGWVQDTAKDASSDFVWLGLRYTCVLDLWFWVNDQLVCYDRWAPGKTEKACDMAVAMTKETHHEWVTKRDSNTFNFICVER